MKYPNFLKNKIVVIFIILILLICFTLFVMKTFNGMAIKNQNTKILFETTEGNITIELYSDSPITTGNFEKLVKQGFYDGTIFHRVIRDFMIQGGDPTGTGMGSPGYTIKDEFIPGHSNLRGTIAMANSGPNSGGSQFFINLIDNTYLDYDKPPFSSKHPVFGEVVEGMNVVDKIGNAQAGTNDKPLREIRIIKARAM